MSDPVQTVAVRQEQNGSAITQVNVRLGPGTNFGVLTSLPAGCGGLPVLTVSPDDRQKTAPGGGVFQWYRLALPDGRQGWVREDLVQIERPPAPERVAPVEPAPPADGERERIRRAAFNITAGFEGGGYASYQTYDAGIVSYGRIQFTLASGSLLAVLVRYLEAASTPTAGELRAAYLDRVRAADSSLRHDRRLRELLIAAAAEPTMQSAQDAVATELYWDRVVALSVEPRGIRLPLSQALIFDMAVNHGVRHDMLNLAETALGVAPRSRVGDNGVSEQDFIARVAHIRRDRLHRIANTRSLPGLKPRGDFWVALVEAGDWTLAGSDAGEVVLKPGRAVQVRRP